MLGRGYGLAKGGIGKVGEVEVGREIVPVVQPMEVVKVGFIEERIAPARVNC